MRIFAINRRAGVVLPVMLALFVIRVRAQPVELPSRALLKGHWDDVNDVEFSPDGKILASAGAYDQTVRLWDPASGGALEVIKQPFKVAELSFSPDGKTLAVGGWPPSRRNSRRYPGPRPQSVVGLLVLKTGKSILVRNDYENLIFCLCFSPDGRTLAVGLNGASEQLILWDVQEKRVARVLAGGGLFISDVAFSPDGSVIGGTKGTLLLLDALWEVWAMRGDRLFASVLPSFSSHR